MSTQPRVAGQPGPSAGAIARSCADAPHCNGVALQHCLLALALSTSFLGCVGQLTIDKRRFCSPGILEGVREQYWAEIRPLLVAQRLVCAFSQVLEYFLPSPCSYKSVGRLRSP